MGYTIALLPAIQSENDHFLSSPIIYFSASVISIRTLYFLFCQCQSYQDRTSNHLLLAGTVGWKRQDFIPNQSAHCKPEQTVAWKKLNGPTTNQDGTCQSRQIDRDSTFSVSFRQSLVHAFHVFVMLTGMAQNQAVSVRIQERWSRSGFLDIEERRLAEHGHGCGWMLLSTQ